MTLEELKNKIELKRIWKQTHRVAGALEDAFNFVRYRIPQKIRDARYEVKYAWQRVFKGYDSPMVWGYWYDNAKLNIKILKELKENKCGIFYTLPELSPALPHDEEFARQEKAWEAIMDLIIDGFQAILDEDDAYVETDGKYDIEATKKVRDGCQARWEAGMKAYVEHYRGLWD